MAALPPLNNTSWYPHYSAIHNALAGDPGTDVPATTVFGRSLLLLPGAEDAREALELGPLAQQGFVTVEYVVQVTFPADVAETDVVWGWDATHAGNLVRVDLSSLNAPTTEPMIVDMNKNGDTVFTTAGNRPQIAIAAKRGESGAPNSVSFAKGDRFEFQVDQNTDDLGRVVAQIIWSRPVS